MWTETESAKKNLGIQKYPDTCERGITECVPFASENEEILKTVEDDV